MFAPGPFVYPRAMVYFVAHPEGPGGRAATLSPPRERMQTIPYDLAEYAWLHTGPTSWSAEPEHDDPRRSQTVYLVDDAEGDDGAAIDEREAYVLSLVAPQATIADVIDMAGMPASEVLSVLAGLAMRGMVSVDRPTSPSTD